MTDPEALRVQIAETEKRIERRRMAAEVMDGDRGRFAAQRLAEARAERDALLLALAAAEGSR